MFLKVETGSGFRIFADIDDFQYGKCKKIKKNYDFLYDCTNAEPTIVPENIYETSIINGKFETERTIVFSRAYLCQDTGDTIEIIC